MLNAIYTTTAMGAKSAELRDKADKTDKTNTCWPYSKLFIFVLQTAWTLVLAGVLTWKIYADGWESVFSFLTNWVWFTNLIFFSIDLVFGYASKNVFRYFSFYAFWIVNGLNAIVFWLVFPLLGTNDALLRDATLEFTPELAFVGDRLFHVLHVVVALLWYFLHFREMRDHGRQDASIRKHYLQHFFLTFFFAGILAPCAVGVAYRLAFNIGTIYSVDFPLIFVILGAALILFVHNGIALYAVSTFGEDTKVETNFARLESRLALKLFSLAWIMLCWALFVFWIIRYGARSFFMRFELWTWLYMSIYLTIDLTLPWRSARLSLANNPIAAHWYAFWPLNTLVWAVFVLAIMALSENALGVLDLNGDGDFNNLELLLDRVRHVLILVFLLIYTFMRSKSLALTVKHMRGYVLALLIFIIPLAIAIIWQLSTSGLTAVYGLVDIPGEVWIIYFAVIAVILGCGTYLVIHQGVKEDEAIFEAASATAAPASFFSDSWTID